MDSQGKKGKYYRFGEPAVGKKHSAFRTLDDLMEFLQHIPEPDAVPLFEIEGIVVEDEGGPDGLYVLVDTYKQISSSAEELEIGVVGYSAQKFNESEAERMIFEAFNQIDAQYAEKAKVVVSGLTNIGIPALAYKEAAARGWRTVGIACSKAVEYECFPVDEEIIVGDEWGDESSTFLDTIDLLVRIGGGKQSLTETAEMKSRGKPVIEYDLPAE